MKELSRQKFSASNFGRDLGIFALMTIGSATVECYKACKHAEFPLCLDRALVQIFGDRRWIDPILVNNTGGSPETRIGFSTCSSDEVWKTYVDIISFFERTLGEDVAAVIENQVLKEIEHLGCFECPIFKLEVERKKKGYENSHPRIAVKTLVSFP